MLSGTLPPSSASSSLALSFSPPSVVTFSTQRAAASAAGGPPPLPATVGRVQAHNTSDAYVVFKVKTHAAERYHVAPHIALLAPGDAREVVSE